MSIELPIDKIVIGDRARKEMGNIAALAESIRERSCLHPPAVREVDGRYLLVAGARRLAAMRSLGFDRVTVTVVRSLASEISALMAEGEENTCREPFTPSEAVAHAERVEGVIAAKAKERQRDHGDTAPGRPNTSVNLAEVSAEDRSGRETRTQVAKSTGLGRTTLAKAREVVEAARNESLPEPVRQVARDAVEQMDRTGKVDRAYRDVETAKVVASPLYQYINAGGEHDPVQVARWLSEFQQAITKAHRLFSFDPDEVAHKAEEDQIESVRYLAERATTWLAEVETKRRTSLRLVEGGNR